jgi:large subunit ribosomal protein L22
MISKATSKFIRMSPQKARLAVDLIRGKNVNEALMTLKFTNKPKSTREIEKVVKSAVANATHKDENIDVDNLFVETCFINEGPRLKRIRPAPMAGRIAISGARRISRSNSERGNKWVRRHTPTDSGLESPSQVASRWFAKRDYSRLCTKTRS